VIVGSAAAFCAAFVAKGRVVGLDIVEITPSTDLNQITCITAGRLVVNFVGAAVRAGYFD
jgi:agmatinase